MGSHSETAKPPLWQQQAQSLGVSGSQQSAAPGQSPYSLKMGQKLAIFKVGGGQAQGNHPVPLVLDLIAGPGGIQLKEAPGRSFSRLQSEALIQTRITVTDTVSLGPRPRHAGSNISNVSMCFLKAPLHLLPPQRSCGLPAPFSVAELQGRTYGTLATPTDQCILPICQFKGYASSPQPHYGTRTPPPSLPPPNSTAHLRIEPVLQGAALPQREPLSCRLLYPLRFQGDLASVGGLAHLHFASQFKVAGLRTIPGRGHVQDGRGAVHGFGQSRLHFGGYQDGRHLLPGLRLSQHVPGSGGGGDR